MLAPAGAEKAYETVIPAVQQATEMIADAQTTERKLRHILMAESGGSTISAVISIVPIIFIPRTTVIAQRSAISNL